MTPWEGEEGRRKPVWLWDEEAARAPPVPSGDKAKTGRDGTGRRKDELACQTCLSSTPVIICFAERELLRALLVLSYPS